MTPGAQRHFIMSNRQVGWGCAVQRKAGRAVGSGDACEGDLRASGLAGGGFLLPGYSTSALRGPEEPLRVTELSPTVTVSVIGTRATTVWPSPSTSRSSGPSVIAVTFWA